MKSISKIITGVLAASLLSAALLSCASTSAAATPAEEKIVDQGNLLIRGTVTDPAKLSKNEVLSVTTKVNNPQYFQLSAWSKIRIVSDLFDELNIHQELTNEQKYKLMSYIFDDLPKNGKDGIAREVRLGKFFSNGKGDAANLTIRVGVLTPGDDAKVKNEKVIILYTNAVLLANGDVARGAGQFINFDRNVTMIVGYNNGLLTEGNDFNAKELNEKDISSVKGFQAVLLAQQFLADEDLSNDVKAYKLCKAVLDTKDAQPAEVITAMLMIFNYYIACEDVANAQVWWDKVIEYCPNVPGDMTPENLEAMNGECLYLLKALKA